MPTQLENPFKPLQPEDVSSEVTTKLLGRSSLYILPEHAPKSIVELTGLRSLVHENGDVSYLASHTKVYSNQEREEVIYLVDTSSAGAVTGEGEVRYNRMSDNDYFMGKPFVGWTSTAHERRHEGLAERRLMVMKLAASAEFGLALHSNTLFCDDNARKTWERMVQSGLAEKYIQKRSSGGGHLRYKFK